MPRSVTRRRFLGRAASIGMASFLAPSIGSLGLRADEVAAPLEGIVRFTPDIERLVRLLEETPKNQCIDAVAGELRRGLGYRPFLAALFLAGIRNVNPQPPGFKFHCVMVIEACHRLSLELPESDRLLPLFYALGEFKDSQAEDVRLGDFTLRQPKGKILSAELAATELAAAMAEFDGERADRAIVSLVHEQGTNQLFETLFRWGAQDYRNIGHKIIFATGCQRVLSTIGWQHAEPVLRSLVWALVDFGRDRKLNGYAFEDQSYLPNVALAESHVAKLPSGWAGPRRDAGATRELYEALRGGDRDAACRLAIEQLTSGKNGAAGVWDAVHLVGDELERQQPGIFGIHAVTSKSSMHYAFRMTAEPITRLILLLQGVGWEAQFHRLMHSPEGNSRSGSIRAERLVDLEPAEVSADPREAAESVLAAIKAERESKDAASRLALGFALRHGDSAELGDLIRHTLATKGDDPHEFKFSMALNEDDAFIDPAWRPWHRSTVVYYLKGAAAAASPWLAQAGEALKG